MVKIDLIDKKILYELDKDARISIKAIAKKVKKSKQFVEYRIYRMNETGVIRGYNTIIDMTSLGYHAFRINVKLGSITDETRDNIIKDMIKDKEIWWYGHTEGKWNICFAIALKDISSFNEYWEGVLNRYGTLIKYYTVIYYNNLTWYPSKFLIDDKSNNLSLKILSRNNTKIKDIDKIILRTIAKNARFSYIELEKELKVHRNTIKKRVEYLKENGVILGYKVWFDERLLEYRFYKVYLQLKKWDEYDKLYAYSKTNPFMITVNKTIGGSDFEIELKARDLQHFEGIMNDLFTNLPGLIDSYEFMAARSENKMVFLPDDF